MRDSHRYFEARTEDAGTRGTATAVDFQTALRAAKSDMQEWDKHLAQLTIDRRAGEVALQAMTQSVSAQTDSRRHKGERRPRDRYSDVY